MGENHERRDYEAMPEHEPGGKRRKSVSDGLQVIIRGRGLNTTGGYGIVSPGCVTAQLREAW